MNLQEQFNRLFREVQAAEQHAAAYDTDFMFGYQLGLSGSLQMLKTQFPDEYQNFLNHEQAAH